MSNQKRIVRVRRHYRKRTNGVSVVRQHSRKSLTSKVDALRQKYQIDTPITINEVDSTPDDSYAFTDTLMKGDTAVGHVINYQPDKIDADNESCDKVLEHELAHIIDKETGLIDSKAGKNIITAIESTQAYKKLLEKNVSYELKPEELFARAYAQFQTGHTTPADIENGYAWSSSDFKIVAGQIKKMLPK